MNQKVGINVANILVIDDDEQFRAMLVQMLTLEAHHVSIATDGQMGLTMLAQKTPDLIITDILMPKMDGIDFILELARRHVSIPIIAVSGGRRSISAEFNLESAALLGVKATLAKPFVRDDLRKALAKALG
jgi:CheY-like chemotaxis protein